MDVRREDRLPSPKHNEAMFPGFEVVVAGLKKKNATLNPEVQELEDLIQTVHGCTAARS